MKSREVDMHQLAIADTQISDCFDSGKSICLGTTIISRNRQYHK